MSSDIELGDDESITLACAQLRARNTAGETQPVILHGALSVQDRIFLAEPRPVPKPEAPPSKYEGMTVGGFGTGRVVAVSPSGASPTPTFKGGDSYSLVYSRLKQRPVPVDLWEELQMLREAVLDLHQRLKKKGL